MDYHIEGELKEVYDEQVITDKFRKKEFVIGVTQEGKDWVDFIKFQLVNNNCSKIDGFQIGQKLFVRFNINGRAWKKDDKTQYFNSLTAYEVKSAGGVPVQQELLPQDTPPKEELKAVDVTKTEGEDDLPF